MGRIDGRRCLRHRLSAWPPGQKEAGLLIFACDPLHVLGVNRVGLLRRSQEDREDLRVRIDGSVHLAQLEGTLRELQLERMLREGAQIGLGLGQCQTRRCVLANHSLIGCLQVGCGLERQQGHAARHDPDGDDDAYDSRSEVSGKQPNNHHDPLGC